MYGCFDGLKFRDRVLHEFFKHLQPVFRIELLQIPFDLFPVSFYKLGKPFPGILRYLIRGSGFPSAGLGGSFRS